MDVRHGEGKIMMALFGLLEKEEDREAMHRMMVEAVRRGGVTSASPSPEEGGYTAYIEMPGTWLNIGFYGDEENSEQIFIIPFREGDGVKYFVVRDVSEARRVTRCDMVRIMDWDQLIEYLGDVWEEMWDATLFKLKAAEASMP